MRKSSILGVAMLVATVAARAVGQDVLVVDESGGPGSDATEIAAAVALASPGDTVLVRSGHYAPFTLDALPLSVIADTGAQVVVDGQVRVQNLPAGQVVLLRGLSTGTPQGHGLVAIDDVGALRIENCAFTAEDDYVVSSNPGGDGMTFWKCADVAVTRCEAVGGKGQAYQTGGAGIASYRSTLAIHGSSLTGGDGGSGSSVAANGGPSLRSTVQTFALLSGCELTGGHGGDSNGSPGCGAPGAGGDSIQMTSNACTTYTVQCVLTPGPGGVEVDSTSCPAGPTGQLVKFGLFPSTYVPLSGLARALRAPAPVRVGDPLQLQFVGEPADTALLLVSPFPANLFLAQFSGALLVPPTSLLLVMGTVQGTGALTFATTMPPLPPALQVATLHLQSAYKPAAGGTVLGGGSELVVLAQGY